MFVRKALAALIAMALFPAAALSQSFDFHYVARFSANGYLTTDCYDPDANGNPPAGLPRQDWIKVPGACPAPQPDPNATPSSAPTSQPTSAPAGGGIIPRGIYNAATQYNVGDAVTYGGSSFVAEASSEGVTPVVNDPSGSWMLLAQGAVQGPQGPAGAGLPAVALNTYGTPQANVTYEACGLICTVFYQLSAGSVALTFVDFPGAPHVSVQGFGDLLGFHQLAAPPTQTGVTVESISGGLTAGGDSSIGEAFIVLQGASLGFGGAPTPAPTAAPTATPTASPTDAPTDVPTDAPTPTAVPT